MWFLVGSWEEVRLRIRGGYRGLAKWREEVEGVVRKRVGKRESVEGVRGKMGSVG